MPIYDRSPVQWTTAQLLTDVRRKASLPVTATDWPDAVVLREATDVLWGFAGWALAQGGEGRLLASLDRPVTSALTGAYGAREFVLPPGAVAGSIEMVTWTDASGQNQSRLTRIDHGEEGVWTGPQETGSPATYTLLADRIRLYPIANSGGTLRITYMRRLPELILDTTAAVATVSALSVAGTMTLSNAMAPALAVGDSIDVIRATYPYSTIVASAEITVMAGNNPTTDVSQASLNAPDIVGARVVRAGQSPYVPLPLELRTCFTEKVAANIMRVIGDMAGMQASEQAAAAELARTLQLLSPRSRRDKPYAINPFSHLRTRMTRGRW